LEVSEVKRPKELEHENARLKKLLAEAELDKAMLKDVIEKKAGEAGWSETSHWVSETALCRQRTQGMSFVAQAAGRPSHP
jgi:hypothetical protein